MPRLASIPIIFLVIYSGERIIGLSGRANTSEKRKNISKNYGGAISWVVMMLGIIYLGQQQGLPRYSTSLLLMIINIIARWGSLNRGYTLGEYIFIVGGRAVSLSLIIQSTWQMPDRTGWIAIIIASIWQVLYRYRLHRPTDTETKNYFLTSKEICNHIWRYSIMATILLPDRGLGLVMVMAYNALILSLYNYSNTLETYTQQPNRILHPRDILKGKTFHEAKDRHETRGWSILKRLYKQGRVPSGGGIQFLQCINIIALLGLLGWTATNYFSYKDIGAMIVYRAGVICFVIALIATNKESYRYRRYKKIALVITVTALYVTMLPLGLSTVSIVIISMVWQILHIGVMLTASTVLDHYGITANDRLFWLSCVIASTSITVIYIIRLPLGSDSIFALACIAISIVAFLAYQTIYHIKRNR